MKKQSPISVLDFLTETSNLDEEQRLQRMEGLQIKEFYDFSLANGLNPDQLKEIGDLIKGNFFLFLT